MGQKDLSEKILEDYNDVFAGIVNVLIFKGKDEVSPDNLVSASVHSQYKAESGRLHEQERDVSKYWCGHGVNIALYGLENQTVSERNMPFRIIGYDGAAYRQQLLQDEKPVPVVSLVLYFGTEKPWNEPLSMKELLDIPPGMEDYVNDYRIHVVNVAWIPDEQRKMFKSDFGIVAEYFVQKRINKDYVPEDKRTIKHVDEVLKLLSVMTGDSRYEKIFDSSSTKEGISMCDVAERLEQQGIEKGRRPLYSFVSKGRISAADAAEEAGVTEEEFLLQMEQAGFARQ